MDWSEKTTVKKTICLFLCVLLVFAVAQPALAGQTEKNVTIIQLENGDYIEVEIVSSLTRASTSSTKTYTYKNSSGVAQWKALLNGTFTYNGTTSSCTSASVAVSIYDNAWYTISKSATKSGSAAYGTVTMGYQTLGVTTTQRTQNLFLLCDANGNLS